MILIKKSFLKCILLKLISAKQQSRSIRHVSLVKSLPTMWKTQVQSPGQKDPLEKGMATHLHVLAWRIPWTEKPGGLQSVGLQGVGHSWATNIFTFTLYILYHVLFHDSVSQDLEHSLLSYTVGPHCFSVLCVIVSICQSQTSYPSGPPLLPLGNHRFLSVSVRLFLFHW